MGLSLSQCLDKLLNGLSFTCNYLVKLQYRQWKNLPHIKANIKNYVFSYYRTVGRSIIPS